MGTRLQYVFLRIKFWLFLLSFPCASLVAADEGKGLDVNNEIFELGANLGIVNIEDFTSEIAPGLSLTFRASEDFFIQYNYLRVGDVRLSLYEQQDAAAVYFTGKGRTYSHYDLLVGYNFFQGEFYIDPPNAVLSSLYLVAGAGETGFGGESRFSYTLGIGYQIALTRTMNLHVDYRGYFYNSGVILDTDKAVGSSHFACGIRYVF